ncbi:retropepsin-like aspartic protease [Flavobacterium sp.]|uniref:retropepsin-like aspartic protease n=1 Tax=Flavobacterium sp. TaxID=239 RepID=UPI003752DE8E
MRKFNFELLSEEDVIIVNATILNKFKFRLALDTAATHCTIDSNVLYFSGYELKNSKGELEIETANGIIIVERYDIEKIDCLGITKNNFEVQVYDFLSHGIISDYDGVIGLNFLKDNKFCIDIPKKEITIEI